MGPVKGGNVNCLKTNICDFTSEKRIFIAYHKTQKSFSELVSFSSTFSLLIRYCIPKSGMLLESIIPGLLGIKPCVMSKDLAEVVGIC